ncbi:neural precursor cell expressed, developmentally down-regulated 1 [Seminavis robusta]|uniref:Neural cell expressed, developmentally down-regulated 1 n=1 Tax=Seminavis robusta TaxID=568900 RepID=A0A9N8DTL6_9STRA|nr:neural precursor cell expressed, developmentally down-regulated 1 [Seminavis robusta]|eukprot:Sro348_g123180.1 neural precursor cell expressed, developmentally down-regulated 1 (819) ;mRNA; f:16032-18592
MSSSFSSGASPVLVIGSGSTVVTWDCRDELSSSEEGRRFYRPFSPPNNDTTTSASTGSMARISDLAWNHNGQVLACCSTATALEDPIRKNIVLLSSSTGSMLDSFRHTDSSSDPTKGHQNRRAGTGPAATCVAFGGKSRYLCIGDQQGDVCLWDLKKQSRVRQFKSKRRHPCLQACLDPTATYVCALSAETFTLFHLRQATFAKQWTFGGTHHNNSNNSTKGGWNQFRFSPLQPSLMALGDTTGRIQLHDGLEYEQPQLVCGGGHTSHLATSTSLLPHHASPITGLAFSTQNSKLLANVRANGILEFVDTSTGEVIHHQQTGGNASALAFQGVSCVVGTETGEVQVYDLRKMMQQFGKAVTTHKMQGGQPIKTLEFAPIPKNNGWSTTSTSNSSASNNSTAVGVAGRSRSPPSRRPSGGAVSLGLGNAISFDLESRASMTSSTSYADPVPSIVANSSGLTTATDASNMVVRSGNTATLLGDAPAVVTVEDRKPAATEAPSHNSSINNNNNTGGMTAVKPNHQSLSVHVSSMRMASSQSTEELTASPAANSNRSGGNPSTFHANANAAGSSDKYQGAPNTANAAPQPMAANTPTTKSRSNELPTRTTASNSSSIGSDRLLSQKTTPTSQMSATSSAAASGGRSGISNQQEQKAAAKNGHDRGSSGYTRVNRQYQNDNASNTAAGAGYTGPHGSPTSRSYRGSNNNHNATEPLSSSSSTSSVSNNKHFHPTSEMATFLQSMMRQELQYHMFSLQEDMETSIRNLHVDMIRQFQRQSQEMTSVLRQQQHQIDQLMQENEFLRNQNGALQRQQQRKNGYNLP